MLVFWRYASRRCEKMGKFNLWLFSTQIQMISKCIFRQRVHNEMSRKKKTFPYAVTIVSFNFCEMFFFPFILWKRNLLHPLLFHIIYEYWAVFCGSWFMWNDKCYATSNRFLGTYLIVGTSDVVFALKVWKIDVKFLSFIINSTPFSVLRCSKLVSVKRDRKTIRFTSLTKLGSNLKEKWMFNDVRHHDFQINNLL